MEQVINILIPILVVLGIWLMSKVPTAVRGNRLSMIAMTLAAIITCIGMDLVSLLVLTLFLLIGGAIGLVLARKVSMIQMPQTVALFNGLGGGASALVGIVTLMGITDPERIGNYLSKIFIESLFDTNVTITSWLTNFERGAAVLAIIIGMLTLTGSLVAAGKLHRVLAQKPVILRGHSIYLFATLLLSLVSFAWGTWWPNMDQMSAIIVLAIISSALFGIFFTIRVGGADMPITISLLNSLSGVAGSIAGMAIGNVMLVAVGGIVGASGLLLTQVMCRSMNRRLTDILLGKTSVAKKLKEETVIVVPPSETEVIADKPTAPASKGATIDQVIKEAKSVIIVPGYGMALAQAQHEVKQLADALKKNGATVRYAIHPVAGRMPGHMNVLLAEADVDYEELFEMDAINDDFKETDLAIVIGANDVLNPAAREAEGTPIYGMPVLNVDQAQHVIICNYDTKPGYAGVPNPLYDRDEKVDLLLGDAKETVGKLLSIAISATKEDTYKYDDEGTNLEALLKKSKSVIVVPGYGMALAQAQHEVKQLADALKKNGATVRFAIHPVAGRMPGHMNVLLAEADVDYEELYEMDAINDDFKETDLAIVIGANDVLNPAAREAEGTPIYGMPVLNVDQAKHVIICNYDRNPGYAGVPNPLYDRDDKVVLLLGDAKESLSKLISNLI
ncbi:MAG: NAD(P)(+) transhydrogenase (Re/Si-specific) subunit beta [Porphyromonas sp.]|nr:NAD(P)(+) transhydrogenase (Re/Si-specific) subunit beta [Porphyromonas sp.]